MADNDHLQRFVLIIFCAGFFNALIILHTFYGQGASLG